MAIAVVQEWAATSRETSGYDAVSKEIRRRTQGPPEGCLIHTAGFDGDTFRIFEVWDAQEHWDRFEEDVMRPAVRAAVDAGGAAGTPPSTRTYELYRTMAPEGARA